MEKITNFRLLANGVKNKENKTIKENTVFRSGLLSLASEKDITELKRLNIHTIIDFRSSDEIQRMPVLTDAAFHTYNLDIFPSADPKALFKKDMSLFKRSAMIEMMNKLYIEEFAVTDRFKDALELLLNEKPNTFLFHCTAGKDRTGIFGSILMMILDFDKETIVTEYLKYNRKSAKMLAKETLRQLKINPFMVPIISRLLIHLYIPNISNINSYIETILKEFGAFDRYLIEKFDVTEEKKNLLKERYLY